MREVLDSYQLFIDTFGIEENALYEFGLRETILPPYDAVEQYWGDLKKRIFNNGQVSIRGYGRDGRNTDLYTGLYGHVLNNYSVRKDRTNNMEPQKIISQLTQRKRKVDLLNYQVSHIFGRTKNIFLFEAPWNIALVPKIMDPFTGHETKGRWPGEYQRRFQAYAMERYADFVAEYNELVTSESLVTGVEEYISRLSKSGMVEPRVLLQFERDLSNELSTIGVADHTFSIGEGTGGPIEERQTAVQETPVQTGDEKVVLGILMDLKHEKNRSWVQLRNGCLDLLGRQVSFTTGPMRDTSRAFARLSIRTTGLPAERILELLDAEGLGLKQ